MPAARPCPRKFTATAPAQHAVVTVAASLAGTHSLARPAGPGRADFATAAREAVPALRAADLPATVVTMQGPIRLADYLITRCVEAVVHGCGPAGPARPDRAAQAITAGALPEALAARAPHLVREARQLPLPVWIDAATGRQPVPGSLAAAVPVMTSAARAARGMAHPSRLALRPGLTLLDYFDAGVSGRDFAHGKPDPEIFLTAHEPGAGPRHAIAITGASAGIQAAKAGGMAAPGVAPAGDAGLPATAGADRGHHPPRRRHHRPLRRKAGHPKGITPHDNGITPAPRYRQEAAAADSGPGNMHRLTRSAWYRRSCARRTTTYRTADLAARAATSDRHAVRPAFQNVSDLIADSALP